MTAPCTCTCGSPAIPDHACAARADYVSAFKPIAEVQQVAKLPAMDRVWDL